MLQGIKQMLQLDDSGCFKPGQLEIMIKCACYQQDTWGGLQCCFGKTLIFIACILLICEDGHGTIGLLSEPLQSIINEFKEKLPRYSIEVIEPTATTRGRGVPTTADRRPHSMANTAPGHRGQARRTHPCQHPQCARPTGGAGGMVQAWYRARECFWCALGWPPSPLMQRFLLTRIFSEFSKN